MDKQGSQDKNQKNDQNKDQQNKDQQDKDQQDQNKNEQNQDKDQQKQPTTSGRKTERSAATTGADTGHTRDGATTAEVPAASATAAETLCQARQARAGGPIGPSATTHAIEPEAPREAGATQAAADRRGGVQTEPAPRGLERAPGRQAKPARRLVAA